MEIQEAIFQNPMNQNALIEQVLEFCKICPDELDLTNENHLDQVRNLADSILTGNPSARSLRELETGFCKDKDALPLMAHLAVKLALSKTLLGEIKGPVHVSVVFAAYKEHNPTCAPFECLLLQRKSCR